MCKCVLRVNVLGQDGLQVRAADVGDGLGPDFAGLTGNQRHHRLLGAEADSRHVVLRVVAAAIGRFATDPSLVCDDAPGE